MTKLSAGQILLEQADPASTIFEAICKWSATAVSHALGSLKPMRRGIAKGRRLDSLFTEKGWEPLAAMQVSHELMNLDFKEFEPLPGEPREPDDSRIASQLIDEYSQESSLRRLTLLLEWPRHVMRLRESYIDGTGDWWIEDFVASTMLRERVHNANLDQCSITRAADLLHCVSTQPGRLRKELIDSDIFDQSLWWWSRIPPPEV